MNAAEGSHHRSSAPRARACESNGADYDPTMATDSRKDPEYDLTEQWRRRAAVAVPRTDDDTPILAGTGGRRATREELIAFVAEHAARAEREARERKS